ncbi:Cytochrome P450 94A1 [Hibiscus syriacus]|uniref:Cytochrome P450 94A1 n=1 Tax=Hibiscus syriacus TaxID=106335 RepID=A0A6A2Y8R5_HIBSY|nr:Cytochrome P450 94A1 [Hibiscus syriacus]
MSCNSYSVGGSTENERKPYVVYMGEVPENGVRLSAMDEHHNLLLKAVGDEDIARESKYIAMEKASTVLQHGFFRMKQRDYQEDGVASVFVNTKRKLLTTRSWDFLGVPESSNNGYGSVESNIIVGLMDTGIWPGSPSFNDAGYGPPPAKWKGKCDKGANFTGCNNKVIGARYYHLEDFSGGPDEPTPVDTDGHGTHTASTAAGIPVKGSSLYGIAKGTARGGVPSARIAMYKVCWSEGCSDMYVLAAFDDAIANGVDLISISLGGDSMGYFNDSVAIGAFHAMRKGILTSCAGGNGGPTLETVQNVAPWILTVAASSVDRQFFSTIKLGDGTITSGFGISTFSMKNKMYPFTNGAHATNVTIDFYYGNIRGRSCMPRVSDQDDSIKMLDGAGTIMAIDEPTDHYSLTLIPATVVVRSKSGDKLDRYINTTSAYRMTSITGDPTDRRYSAFNIMSGISMSCPHAAAAPGLNILAAVVPNARLPKFPWPADVTAPGLNILAAPGLNILDLDNRDPTDRRYSAFTLCPAYLCLVPMLQRCCICEVFPPGRSPAAIKSLSCYCNPMKIKDEYEELSSGSGQINPTRAVNPGLIFDINEFLHKFPLTENFSSVSQDCDQCASGSWRFNEDGTDILSATLEWRSNKGHSVKSPIVIFKQQSSF